MATYDFKCSKCESILADVHLPMAHEKKDRPLCCDQNMEVYITCAPMVHWVHPAFDAVPMPAIPGKPVVSTHKQRKELMAKHDLVDANDISPPTRAEDQATQKKMRESIEKISAPADVARALDIV